jgi:hypothetical protein
MGWFRLIQGRQRIYDSLSDNSSSNSNKIMTQEELEDNLLLYMEDELLQHWDSQSKQ